MNSRRLLQNWQRASALVALCAALAGGCAHSRAADGTPLGGDVGEQFVQRAREYATLRNAAVKEVPQLVETSSPVEIAAREKLLANAIRAQRKDAQAGDVFDGAGPPIRRLVREDWQARPRAERGELWEELPRGPAPAVNAPYPASLPLATFPPELLAQLPTLPEELEYRFAGPHLILRDTEANFVVDVLPDVLSDPGAPRLGAEADQ